MFAAMDYTTEACTGGKKKPFKFLNTQTYFVNCPDQRSQLKILESVSHTPCAGLPVNHRVTKTLTSTSESLII